MTKRGWKSARRTPARAGPAEQLDQALESMMAGSAPARVSSAVAELLRIADGLRDLPRAEFKAHLAADLASARRSKPRGAMHRRPKEGSNMPGAKDQTAEPARVAARPNLNPVMPFMYIRDPAGAVEFYRNVFGARVLMGEAEPGGVVSHAQFQIGESRFMISNPASGDVSEYAAAGWARTPQELGGTPVHLYVQVEDADRVFGRAVAAGAKVVHQVRDMEWGDRVGGFQDPYGHIWYVATPLPPTPGDE
jgi:PhnB protein